MARCLRCGTQVDPPVATCPCCGTHCEHPAPVRPATAPAGPGRGTVPSPMPVLGRPRVSVGSPALTPCARVRAPGLPGRAVAPAVSGVVVHQEPTREEPPDPHVLRGLLLTLYSLPLLFIVLAVVFAGWLFLALLRIRGSGRGGLLGTTVLWFAGRRPVGRTVPVQRFRVRDIGQVEHEVQMKGYLRTGSIARGDQVQLWGTWRDQTLQVRSGLNARTGSAVILDDRTFSVLHVALVAADTLVWVLILCSALAVR